MRAAVLLLGLLLVSLLPAASAQGPVALFVDAPSVAGTGRTVSVNITVAGGPAEEDGTFSVTVFLRGEDLGTASPVEESPFEASNSDGSFQVNVTLPDREGRVEVVVEGNSSRGDVWRTETATRAIDVLRPVVLRAVVENRGEVTVLNARAVLLVDGEVKAEATIERLAPGATHTLRFEYLPVGLTAGTHRWEIRVDLNGDGVIDPTLGEVALEGVFTREAEPINPLYIALGAGGAFVAALFVGAYLRRRRG